jgi:hypothetical protein
LLDTLFEEEQTAGDEGKVVDMPSSRELTNASAPLFTIDKDVDKIEKQLEGEA